MGDAAVADTSRSKAGPSRAAPQPAVDPRQALAQQYLQQANAKLDEEEASKPRAVRRAAGRHSTAGFSLSIDKSVYVHVILVSVALAFAALVILMCYVFMVQTAAPGGMIAVVVYTIAIPVGVVTFAALSYVSVCFLSIVETTSAGHTEIGEALYGGWREWFWTLPTTLGMLAIAAAVGWGLSFVVPLSTWLLIRLSFVIVYPILQLSALENGTPLAPVSTMVLRSLAKRPVAWVVFYALTLLLISVVWLVGRLAWYDPPVITMIIMGAVAAVALFVYAWLLGQLAKLISTGDEK
jgi:uncharacterized membrane protein